MWTAIQLSTVLLTFTQAIFLGIPENWDPGLGTSTGGAPGPRMSRWDPARGTPKYSSWIRDPEHQKWDAGPGTAKVKLGTNSFTVLMVYSTLKDRINPVQLLIFNNVIRCSRLPLWVDYFIHSSSINRYIFSSIKEINWLINKGMCVLLFNVFKHLLLRKTDVLKTCRKSKFPWKKIWRNALALKNKKV